MDGEQLPVLPGREAGRRTNRGIDAQMRRWYHRASPAELCRLVWWEASGETGRRDRVSEIKRHGIACDVSMYLHMLLW